MSLKVGELAPNFSLKNTDNIEVSLEQFKGKQNVVLLFFPLAFSSVCTEELCSTRDNMKIYESFEAAVFGISVDSFFSLQAFRSAQNLNFDLLSDFNKTVSGMYDVLYQEFFGMNGVSKRSAFVIDKEGVVQYAEVLDDAGQQPNYDLIQQTLSELEG